MKNWDENGHLTHETQRQMLAVTGLNLARLGRIGYDHPLGSTQYLSNLTHELGHGVRARRLNGNSAHNVVVRFNAGAGKLGSRTVGVKDYDRLDEHPVVFSGFGEIEKNRSTNDIFSKRSEEKSSRGTGYG